MKKKIIASSERNFKSDQALSIKTNEAYQSYLNELKEVKQVFEKALKNKSFTLELDAKSKEKLTQLLD